MKNVAVLTEDGAFSLFFNHHPGAFDSSRLPTPGNLPSKAKKMLMPGGQPGGGGGWAQVELTDALLKLYSNANSGRSESDPCPFAQTRLLVTPQTIQHSWTDMTISLSGVCTLFCTFFTLLCSGFFMHFVHVIGFVNLSLLFSKDNSYRMAKVSIFRNKTIKPRTYHDAF